MPSLAFVSVPFSEVARHAKDALREGVLLRQGLTPIDWFAGEIDGKTIGYIGLLRVSATRARVRGRYVLPEFRGQGYGHFLLVELLAVAAAKQFKVVERTTKRWKIGVDNGWRIVKRFGPDIGATIEIDV